MKRLIAALSPAEIFVLQYAVHHDAAQTKAFINKSNDLYSKGTMKGALTTLHARNLMKKYSVNRVPDLYKSFSIPARVTTNIKEQDYQSWKLNEIHKLVK